ncbi:uncharacterized protein J4E79_000837 [Alternaria viburni]|uniref:uncharacterized protein n=1 Tax=Alternaria viburni TaxID=566460 RepID=UPI0020C27184|nr:uncharacterized protein J4E79_000837 [Alternaria viburni]KAI4670555.1 hypothetical protein J4E79_000837 [Alternaria viburni]
MSACLKPLEVVQKRNKLALELDNNTGGQCTRKLINEWDKNCLANHMYCGQASDSAFLPTRLLEINDVGNPTTCRLVLREEVPCASRYTALSYRWGAMKTKGETRLLESTFDTMRTGLPLSSLPKTYVDAIDVTSWLGIRYIWIDAICIIQDLLHDWRAEASTMQAIYRNSYLTISAIAGTHDNPGLFYARDPVRVQPTIVNIAYTSCDNPVPFVHRDEKRKEAESFQMGNVTMERGWCLQERLLSPRVLHFGSHQVFWECREQRASDKTPESLDVDTGEVTGGQFELRGPWVTIVTTGKKGILDNNNFLAHFQYLDPSSALEKPLVIETDDSVYHDTEIIYDTQDDMVKQAFCMPICTWRNELPTWHFRGIVLVPVEDGGFNYRRIGLVDGFFKTEEEAHTFFSQFPRRSVTVT